MLQSILIFCLSEHTVKNDNEINQIYSNIMPSPIQLRPNFTYFSLQLILRQILLRRVVIRSVKQMLGQHKEGEQNRQCTQAELCGITKYRLPVI